MKTKRFVFDLDGTICEETLSQERIFATAKKEIIEIINNLFDNQNFIIIYTARGWDQYKLTEYWLNQNKVKYNILICGKPIYDRWIDDRSIHPKNIKTLLDESID